MTPAIRPRGPVAHGGPPAWTAAYVGLPWKEMGRTRAGLDCWGLFRLVMAEQFGVALPAYDAIGWGASHRAGPRMDRRAALHALGRIVGRHVGLDGGGPFQKGGGGLSPTVWHAIGAGYEREGDGVLLRVQGQPIHVGVVAGGGFMLHIEAGIEACLERYGSPVWVNRRIGFFRHASRMD
jgi:cell wall-associated NlpC family hydrolase